MEPKNQSLETQRDQILGNSTQPFSIDHFLKKITSRKFILSLIGVITGICGMVGFNDNTTAVIAFTTIEVLSFTVYLITEGHIDAKSIEMAAKVGTEIIEIVEAIKNGKESTVNTSNGVADGIMSNEKYFRE